MSDLTTQELLTQELATVEAEIELPVAPFNFGSDLSVWSDADEVFTELVGTDIDLIAQAIFRRLQTPRGGLLDDPTYGLDLRSYLSAGMTEKDVALLQNSVTAEIQKDDRVDEVAVQASLDMATSTLTLQIDVTTVDPETSFEMVMAVNTTEAFIVELTKNG